MDLAEFLLARIAEDEARVTDGAQGTKTSAYGWHTVDCGVDIGYWATGECVCRYVDRVLAECKAKRQVVEHAGRLKDSGFVEGGILLRTLALPHADHPDYRPEWSPQIPLNRGL